MTTQTNWTRLLPWIKQINPAAVKATTPEVLTAKQKEFENLPDQLFELASSTTNPIIIEAEKQLNQNVVGSENTHEAHNTEENNGWSALQSVALIPTNMEKVLSDAEYLQKAYEVISPLLRNNDPSSSDLPTSTPAEEIEQPKSTPSTPDAEETKQPADLPRSTPSAEETEPEVYKINQSDKKKYFLLSEYFDMEEIMKGAFPHLFLLGM
jgi:hypothetical protein